MSAGKKKYSGQSDEAHPEIYTLAAMPEPLPEKKPGQLPDDMIRQFFEKVRRSETHKRLKERFLDGRNSFVQ